MLSKYFFVFLAIFILPNLNRVCEFQKVSTVQISNSACGG